MLRSILNPFPRGYLHIKVMNGGQTRGNLERNHHSLGSFGDALESVIPAVFGESGVETGEEKRIEGSELRVRKLEFQKT